MSDKTFRDRTILTEAQNKGFGATIGAYFRLSGPGWLQSAITLGGGSLIGALYLGMLGGTNMLWLQLVAIVIGVIMLSAISYVTLSTKKRPYAAINEYVNPVLGTGWVLATILANMIWILPQFALCYDALDKNLTGGFGDKVMYKYVISGVIAVLASTIVIMSFRPGWASRIFDIILKLLVGMIVVCFVLVVVRLFSSGSINWGEIMTGFIPNLTHWNSTAPAIQELLAELPDNRQAYWKNLIIKNQQSSMIGVTATAVGLNMTFLLPYSMLARGWDKPFRGLARWDLMMGMAVPYIVVTTCIVIASAHAFHAKADEKLLSSDPAVIQESVLFKSVTGVFEARFKDEHGAEKTKALNAKIVELKQEIKKTPKNETSKLEGLNEDLKAAEAEKKNKLAEFAAGLSETERRLAPTLIKPNAAQLAATLKDLLGAQTANLVFGIGALAMGFSTIVILMLINGYAVAEIFGRPNDNAFRTFGSLVAVAVGFCWFLIWTGESKTWLVVVASTFGAILLPIAYISFFALMNNKRLLGNEKPRGGRMIVWNLLMGIGVLGALAQAWGGISTKASDPQTGGFVIGAAATFILLAIIGFSARPRTGNDTSMNENETKT